jgi:PTS system mannose-specific IIA component
MLVVSHGRLAEELVEAARTIVGDVERLAAVSIGWHDDAAEATARIQHSIERIDRGNGVLLLTDMFGGTPTNLGFALHESDRVEIVTGVNLPMVIKFANLREDLSLREAARRIAAQGREAIHVASEVLETDRPSPAEDSR